MRVTELIDWGTALFVDVGIPNVFFNNDSFLLLLLQAAALPIVLRTYVYIPGTECLDVRFGEE